MPSFTRVLLPSLVFPVLTGLAFRIIFGHMFASGLAAHLTAQCPEVLPTLDSAYPYRVVYTGLSFIDANLCGLVVFFHAAMEPAVFPFLSYFLAAGAPLAIIPALEASREHYPWALASPTLVGALSQLLTAGAVLPLYWLFFVATGAAALQHRPARGTKIPQARAEAAAFGFFIGTVAPTLGMLVLADAHVTGIWQAFPLWAALAGFAHHLARLQDKLTASGFPLVQAVYIGLFVVASSTHIATVWPKVQDGTLAALFVPSFAVPDQAASVELKVLDFLQWDAFFVLSSTIVATLWFPAGIKQFLALTAWYAIAVPLVGPGAAISAAFLWRESAIEARRPRVVEVKEE